MKKYLLIGEVAEKLGLSKASLRYLEKTNSNIKIAKIRGRRYYKASDIEKIVKASGMTYKPKEIELPKHYLVGHTAKLPAIAEEHNIDANKSNLPMTDEKQLDMFFLIEQRSKTANQQNEESEIYLKEVIKIKNRLNATKKKLMQVLE